MSNGKHPETEGEHIVALYGHIEGLKRGHDDLKEDISKMDKKIDNLDSSVECINKKLDDKFTAMTARVLWGMATLIITLIGLFNLFSKH